MPKKKKPEQIDDETARKMILGYVQAQGPCSEKELIVACARNEPKVPSAKLHIRSLIVEGKIHRDGSGRLCAGPKPPPEPDEAA